MRYLIILCFLSFKVYAQEPTYVPMKSNYLYRGIKMDSLFLPPVYPDTATGTTKVNFAGSVIRVGSKLYMRNSSLTQWVDLSSAGGGLATDTTSLSNRINQKVDSVKRYLDSVKYWANGTSYFGYKDSVQNGTFGDDTALVVLAKVHNSTGTLLTRGTVVMMNGATGDVASVIRANNKNDTTSARTIGIVKDNIAIGGTGYVVTQGQASGLNLGAFTAGDVLYLDSIDGGLTKTKPVAPYHNVFIGIVERANNGNGLLYVKPLNGFELDELHTVRITNPINNQLLVYSDTQQLWKNKQITQVLSAASPLSLNQNGGLTQIQIQAAATFQNGYLTYTDWNTFNNKLGAGDTASLSNRINLKLNISDTANMLATYLLEGDTASLSNRINARLLIADTSAMLTNYQRTSAFPIATFGAGSGAAGDTSAFSTTALYGSFFLNAGADTIIVTGYTGVVQGTSASVTPTIWFNDSLNVTAGATKIVNSPSAVTSTTTGNTVTSLDNTKITPGNFVWVTTGTVTTKPTYFNLTLIGYRKR